MSKKPCRIRAAIVVVAVLSFSFQVSAGSDAGMDENPRRATVDYATGFDFEDYNAIRESYPLSSEYLRPWGEHPIIWKHLVNLGLDFDPWTVDPNQGPLLFDGVPELTTIQPGDEAWLDVYEASGAFTDAAGNTVDPVGQWVQTVITDGQEAAIHAAMAIWEWNTPVYINFTYDDGQHVTALVGVIDRVTLSTPGGPPHEVCGWGDEPDFADPASGCAGLVVEAVKMTYYSDVLLCCSQVDYYDGPELPGAEFATRYEQSFDTGQVLYDPPSGSYEHFSPEELAIMSRAQAAGVQLRAADGTLIDAK